MSLGVLIRVISMEGWGQNASRVRCEEIDDGEQGKILRHFGIKLSRKIEKLLEGKVENFV